MVVRVHPPIQYTSPSLDKLNPVAQLGFEEVKGPGRSGALNLPGPIDSVLSSSLSEYPRRRYPGTQRVTNHRSRIFNAVTDIGPRAM